MSDDREVLEYNCYRSNQFNEAAKARELWAQQHGCVDFAEALRIGLIAVGNRKANQVA